MAAVSAPSAIPVFLGEEGEEIFAWIHETHAAPSMLGAVVCSSYGREELCAHRTLLHLAEVAAAEGVPAIRFDYHGTGDSAGDDMDAGRIEAWVRSIGVAIEALKQHTGVSRICLVGVRLGVALAALAAAGRSDVTAMVCIAPVVSGKSFTRELRMLAGTSAGLATAPSSLGYIETGGFLLTDQTQADISAIDVNRIPLDTVTHVLILDREEAPTAKRWSEACASKGKQVNYQSITGYGAMMEGTNYNVIPHDMILTVKHWISVLPDRTAGTVDPRAAQAREAAKNPFARPRASVHEAAVAIEAEVPLAGVASIGEAAAPRGAGSESEGVILLSAGIARRVGPSRLYVELARRWAAAGHTVLRLDLSGIGDSPEHPDYAEQTVYSPEAAREVMEAVNYLYARGGVTRCNIIGMCSGSYHALKAALAGANVHTLVMINPLTFNWKDDDVLTSAYAEHEVAFAAEIYSKIWRDPKRWKRIIRGDFKVRQVARTLMRRLGMAIRSTAFDMARILNVKIKGDLGAELESLAARGIRLRFVFATNEPGRALLATQAGGSIGRLQRKGMLTQSTVPASDHIFTTLEARRRLSELLTQLVFTAGQPSVIPVSEKPAAPVHIATRTR